MQDKIMEQHRWGRTLPPLPFHAQCGMNNGTTLVKEPAGRAQWNIDIVLDSYRRWLSEERKTYTSAVPYSCAVILWWNPHSASPKSNEALHDLRASQRFQPVVTHGLELKSINNSSIYIGNARNSDSSKHPMTTSNCTVSIDQCNQCHAQATAYCFVCEQWFCDICIQADTCQYPDQPSTASGTAAKPVLMNRLPSL